MRVVRIEQLAPGGAALEVHPRLTLLRGASPELRRRLAATLRSICGDGVLEESGVIEVSGVQLALDPPTIEQLRVEAGVDPVIVLGTARPDAGASTSPEPPSAEEDLPPVEVVSSDEAALRAELRAVTVARTELGERMEAARAGLDSFSTAALEVCMGQIDALESRRATLRVDWEREQDERRLRLDAASSQLAAVRACTDRIAGLQVLRGRVEAARDHVVATGMQAEQPDAAAAQLAAQLEAAAARILDLSDRYEQLQGRLRAAADELAAARSAADAAATAARSPKVDRQAVQRLEEVRDEIFAVDDRQSVLGAARNKRRLAELRSEEAILLDRMGFDTYSAYVMGIPSVRADLERSAQLGEAQDHADRLEAEVALLRAQVADRSELDDAAAQLHRLLSEALRLLGSPADPRPPEALAYGVSTGGDAAELVHRAATALRDRTTTDPERVRHAVEDLVVALRDATAAAAALPAPPEGPAVLPPLPAPPFPGEVAVPAQDPATSVVAHAEGWLGWCEALQRWSRSTEGVVVELERRTAELGAGHDAERIGRWAEVEAELDEALDRLAEAQERVRRHEAATAELADLRVAELELRDQERELLVRIAAADAAIVPPAAPVGRPEATSPRGTTGAEGADGDVGPDTAVLDSLDPDAVEWGVVTRLARQRTVSFVGSLPVLVDGLPDEPQARDAVLQRLDRMSDLIQVIVVDDGPGSAAWVDGAGERARRVDL